MDEYVYQLLTEELFYEITLPFLPTRLKLESDGMISPRISPLQKEYENEVSQIF